MIVSGRVCRVIFWSCLWGILLLLGTCLNFFGSSKALETPGSTSGVARAATNSILPSPSSSPAMNPQPDPELGALFGNEIAKLRDPFRRVVQQGEVQKPKGDLEQFAVEEFKLVGVTTGPSRARALLLAPNGTTYIASMNSKVGIRGGIIFRISPSAVVVREKATNILGQEENVDTEILLNSVSAVAPTATSHAREVGQGDPSRESSRKDPQREDVLNASMNE